MTAPVLSPDGEMPLHEMNTTPLIDIMLVLLIMFIITIPAQTHAVKVDLPSGRGTVSEPNPLRNRITIDPRGVIHWNGGAVDRVTLRRYLDQSVRMAPEPMLEIRPDPLARYAVVDAVLADVKRSGVKNLGFVGNEDYSRF